MSKIKFNYNIKKDGWWWTKMAREEDLFGLDWKKETAPIPNNLIKKMKKVNFKKAKNLALDYLKKRESQEEIEKVIEYEIGALEKCWSKKEDLYYKKMEEVFEDEMYRKEFTAYFTTLFMCPYNYKNNWFMISVWKSLPFQVYTICHEIMHLQFINKYYNYITKENKLKKEDFEEIKEGVTVILDEDKFKKVNLIEQRTYPKFKKTYNLVKRLRKKEKSLKEIVDIYIKRSKENN